VIVVAMRMIVVVMIAMAVLFMTVLILAVLAMFVVTMFMMHRLHVMRMVGRMISDLCRIRLRLRISLHVRAFDNGALHALAAIAAS